MLGHEFTGFDSVRRLAVVVLLLTDVGCRKDEPLPMPPSAPLDAAPAPAATADAGTVPDAAPPPAESSATGAVTAKLPVEFNETRKDEVPAVVIAVDVVGAGACSSATAPSCPTGWFKELCSPKYDCVLETIQSPGQPIIKIRKAGGDQVAEALKTKWTAETIKQRKLNNTDVPAWTSAWLTSPDSAPVAVIWSDGMADATNANGVINNEHIKSIGGVWALAGRVQQANPKESGALLVYVLAKPGYVGAGAKVANDLCERATSSSAETGAGAYKVEFAGGTPLELYPGNQVSITATLRESPPSPKMINLLKGAERRAIAINGQKVAYEKAFSLPATLTATRLAGTKKRPFLVPIAEEWKASARSDTGIGGWNVEVKTDAKLPAAWPTAALHILPGLRETNDVAANPKLLDWDFDAKDLRRSVALVAFCSSADEGRHFNFGAMDTLPCPPNAAPLGESVGVGCGDVQAGPLASSVFGVPAVKDLIQAKATQDNCIMRARLHAEQKVWGFGSLADPWIAVVEGNVQVPKACLEMDSLPQSPDIAQFVGLIQAKRKQCDSQLWKSLEAWATAPDTKQIVRAFSEQKLNLTVPSEPGGKKNKDIPVNKLYAWRLLQRFAEQLGARSLDEWHQATSTQNGQDPSFELLRIVVESPHAK